MAHIKDIRDLNCAYCGRAITGDKNSGFKNKFCCEKCRSNFELSDSGELKTENNSCVNSDNNSKPGKEDAEIRFSYLDDRETIGKILDFHDDRKSSATFYIPSIQCASCIKTLEKLYSFNEGILDSRLDFLAKTINVTFDHNTISLKEVVILLTSLGYEPEISLDIYNKKENNSGAESRKLILKIGVAGFCLGNIMMLSFPEYLGLNSLSEHSFRTIFNWLNILFSLPVFFYCGSVYFKSAWNGIRHKIINIDFPVSAGLIALFSRSLYEIIFFNNAGFSDSLAGLIFLLLIGKFFQNKTFQSLNFERDYKSYFPVSVTIKSEGKNLSIPVYKLKEGDRIIVRNNEIIPADSILFNGTGNIDYSFVTGESAPGQKVMGEIIYAGGRHFGSAIELEVVRKVSQSYLTQLWNEKAFDKKSEFNFQNITNTVSKYYTFTILLIASCSAAYWYSTDINLALNAFTTVLIIACPCALALTSPFALGNALRIFGKNKFYLKNSHVVENISRADAVVFDKTGTITNNSNVSVMFAGSQLTLCEQSLVKSLVKNTNHPLSRKIYESIHIREFSEIINFIELTGKGISGEIEGKKIRLGTISYILEGLEYDFDDIKSEASKDSLTTNVFLSINDVIKGYYSFNNIYRGGLEGIINNLSGTYELSLISGDNDSEKNNLKKYFKKDECILFNKKPEEKLRYIKELQKRNKNVIMIGDGLNDAGALKQSNTGISVSENISNFSPACDAIIDASVFSRLDDFLMFSKTTMKIIRVSFTISFIYNALGLYLAAQGKFSPLIAAVLMPLNSISIILFVIGSTNFFARRRKLL